MLLRQFTAESKVSLERGPEIAVAGPLHAKRHALERPVADKVRRHPSVKILDSSARVTRYSTDPGIKVRRGLLS